MLAICASNVIIVLTINLINCKPHQWTDEGEKPSAHVQQWSGYQQIVKHPISPVQPTIYDQHHHPQTYGWHDKKYPFSTQNVHIYYKPCNKTHKKPHHDDDDEGKEKDKGGEDKTVVEITTPKPEVTIDENASSDSSSLGVDISTSLDASKETTFLTQNVTQEDKDSGLDATKTTSEDFGDAEAVTAQADKNSDEDRKKKPNETDEHQHHQGWDIKKWDGPSSYHPHPHPHNYEHVYPKYTILLPFHLVPATKYPYPLYPQTWQSQYWPKPATAQ